MLPGLHTGVPARNCMFPWTIPDQSDADASAASRDGRTRGTHGDDEESADEKPVAYRAWCVEHAEELNEG